MAVFQLPSGTLAAPLPNADGTVRMFAWGDEVPESDQRVFEGVTFAQIMTLLSRQS